MKTPKLSQPPGSAPRSHFRSRFSPRPSGREVLCAGAVRPRSFLGKDGCSWPVSPARRGGQIRRETLLGGRCPIQGTVCKASEARVTEKGQVPEKELAAGGAGTRRPRGLAVGHFPSLGVQLTAAFWMNSFSHPSVDFVGSSKETFPPGLLSEFIQSTVRILLSEVIFSPKLLEKNLKNRNNPKRREQMISL